MVKTRGWKKMQGMTDQDQCKLCSKGKEERVQDLARCQKLTCGECVKHHDNGLKVVGVWWADGKRILQKNELKNEKDRKKYRTTAQWAEKIWKYPRKYERYPGFMVKVILILCCTYKCFPETISSGLDVVEVPGCLLS